MSNEILYHVHKTKRNKGRYLGTISGNSKPLNWFECEISLYWRAADTEFKQTLTELRHIHTADRQKLVDWYAEMFRGHVPVSPYDVRKEVRMNKPPRPNKRGPYKTKNHNDTFSFKFRMQPEAREQIQKHAKEAGFPSATDWLRSLVQRELDKGTLENLDF